MLLFGAIACQIEEKYGAPRIILLFFISALGGMPNNAHHSLNLYAEQGKLCIACVNASQACMGYNNLTLCLVKPQWA